MTRMISEQTLLRVENLRTVFRRRRAEPLVAVEDMSYTLYTGGSVAIVGESGSGKSVSVRSLLRLLPKTGEIRSGQAWYDGRDLLAISEKELRSIRGQRIGMVFQNAMESLNPTLTLERQLSEVLLWHGLCNRQEARSRAVQALGDVGIPHPEKRVKNYPFQFSGGMRQRAMIAMAIIAAPDLLIADEPTTALDVTVQRQILDLVKAIREDRGMGLVMITHDLGVARYLCEDAIVMKDGHVVETGTVRDILTAPTHEYTQRLLAASIEISDVTDEPDDTPSVTADTGDDAVPEPTGPEPLLRVAGLSKSFHTRAGTQRAVDDVTLEITAGQTLGLVGESGSGKSTVARLVMGLHEPDEGQVLIDGHDIHRTDKHARAGLRRRMQMVFQNPYGSLLPHYTVGGNIAEPLRLHGIGTSTERQDKAAELLRMVGLSPDDAHRYPQQFSGGQQQRIAIARALILDPDILVCDEPTSALDTSIQAQVMDLLGDLQERLGLTVLLISHNLAVVEAMADVIAVMKSGQILEAGAMHEVFGSPKHEYTQQLLDAVLPVRGHWSTAGDEVVAGGDQTVAGGGPGAVSQAMGAS